MLERPRGVGALSDAPSPTRRGCTVRCSIAHAARAYCQIALSPTPCGRTGKLLERPHGVGELSDVRSPTRRGRTVRCSITHTAWVHCQMLDCPYGRLNCQLLDPPLAHAALAYCQIARSPTRRGRTGKLLDRPRRVGVLANCSNTHAAWVNCQMLDRPLAHAACMNRLPPNLCNGQGLRHPLYPTWPLRLKNATSAPATTFCMRLHLGSRTDLRALPGDPLRRPDRSASETSPPPPPLPPVL